MQSPIKDSLNCPLGLKPLTGWAPPELPDLFPLGPVAQFSFLLG